MANVLGCSVGSGSVRKPGKRTFSWVDEEIMKVRNPFAGLLALFFVVAWCLSGSAAFAKPLVPLRTAWLGEHETFLVWYAREKGWDKAEGLDLELLPFESGKNVIDEMQSSNWAIARADRFVEQPPVHRPHRQRRIRFQRYFHACRQPHPQNEGF